MLRLLLVLLPDRVKLSPPPVLPLLLAILPPGAFLVMGLLIALKNHIDALILARKPVAITAAADRRVRVTGVVE